MPSCTDERGDWSALLMFDGAQLFSVFQREAYAAVRPPTEAGAPGERRPQDRHCPVSVLGVDVQADHRAVDHESARAELSAGGETGGQAVGDLV